jgi:threonylcarbamoyladenosine tRNA methylthiotransferase CDKAL1
MQVRICVKNFGCSSNLADGEVLAGCLAEGGYEIVSSMSEAELVVVNTCAVKGPTENRMLEILRRVPRNKKLVVAGCLPLINLDRIKSEICFDGLTGPAAGLKIVDVVKDVSRGKKIIALKEAQKNLPSLLLPRVQTSSVISIIPISYGCLGSCAYCCVSQARGSLRSHNIDEIASKVTKDVGEGFQEFWLTSQDTACYGRDKESNLVELLRVLSEIEGDFKIRLGMMTPNAALDILPDLVKVFQNSHFFKFVHLPLQSGDDEVLRKMLRLYSADDFRRLVSAFRSECTDLTLSTDVICGFPGESSKAFGETIALIEETKPDIVNVSKFFPRPRTKAARLRKDFVSMSEIRDRSRIVADNVRKLALSRNLRWLGWSGEVLIDERGKIPCSWIGRNFAYKPIVVKSASDILGQKLPVRIVEAFPTYLRGKLVS